MQAIIRPVYYRNLNVGVFNVLYVSVMGSHDIDKKDLMMDCMGRN
jgi:hypothetical protein